MLDKCKAFIAYPLGYCIYCSTFWIAIFIYLLYIYSYNIDVTFLQICFETLCVTSMSHLGICICTKYLIPNHPDLDLKFWYIKESKKIGF